MHRYASRVAANVRAEMARQNKTTKDLENLLGIGKSAARSRLLGQTDFSLDEVNQVACMLGLEPLDLMPKLKNEQIAA